MNIPKHHICLASRDKKHDSLRAVINEAGPSQSSPQFDKFPQFERNGIETKKEHQNSLMFSMQLEI